ncbi:MAG: metallophosphoesterase [Gemmataceae bacterium]
MIRQKRPDARRPSYRFARWLGRNWAKLSYARQIEPTWLEINRFEVSIADLPDSFDGFRIVQISDMHCGRHLPPGYLDDAISRAGAESADVIALTGDFVHKGFRHVEEAADSLTGLSAKHGVYAVLGNHDHSIRNALGVRRYRHLSQTITDALAARGVRVLENESVTLRRGDEELHLAGVDDLWSRRCDVDQAFEGLNSATPRVLLAHNPRTIERLSDHRCDLMLSGHTHGGQVNFAKFGRVTLSKKAKRYAAGLYRHGPTQLYVNKGVGCGVRFRYGVRPEVAVFQLRRHA